MSVAQGTVSPCSWTVPGEEVGIPPHWTWMLSSNQRHKNIYKILIIVPDLKANIKTYFQCQLPMFCLSVPNPTFLSCIFFLSGTLKKLFYVLVCHFVSLYMGPEGHRKAGSSLPLGFHFPFVAPVCFFHKPAPICSCSGSEPHSKWLPCSLFLQRNSLVGSSSQQLPRALPRNNSPRFQLASCFPWEALPRNLFWLRTKSSGTTPLRGQISRVQLEAPSPENFTKKHKSHLVT